MTTLKHHIFVCQNVRPPDASKGCCSGRGSEALFDELRRHVRETFSGDEVRVTKSGCLGPCEEGPNIVIYPEGVWYHKVHLEDIDAIIKRLRGNGHGC